MTTTVAGAMGSRGTAITHLQPEKGPSMRVQVQFTAAGEHASQVADWLQEHFPHTAPRVCTQPGLCISLQLPSVHYDSAGSWHSRLMEPVASLDLALEILEDCLASLGIPAVGLLSLHVTHGP